MSVYEKLQNTIDECDLNGYLEILHSDYIFVRHQSGQEVSKEEWIPTVSVMFDAIKEGISRMDGESLLLLLGKGREDHQLINGVKYPHSDIEIVKSFMV